MSRRDRLIVGTILVVALGFLFAAIWTSPALRLADKLAATGIVLGVVGGGYFAAAL